MSRGGKVFRTTIVIFQITPVAIPGCYDHPTQTLHRPQKCYHRCPQLSRHPGLSLGSSRMEETIPVITSSIHLKRGAHRRRCCSHRRTCKLDYSYALREHQRRLLLDFVDSGQATRFLQSQRQLVRQSHVHSFLTSHPHSFIERWVPVQPTRSE